MLDEAARQRLVTNMSGYLAKGVRPDVLARALEWRPVDADLGARLAKAASH